MKSIGILTSNIDGLDPKNILVVPHKIWFHKGSKCDKCTE